MCGIAGVVERGVRSAALLEETARKMAAPLVHRGPDADGAWIDAEAGVGIGHRQAFDHRPLAGRRAADGLRLGAPCDLL